MIFAAIGALNSTFSALDVVLAGLRENGIQIIVNTGNIINVEKDINDTIELLQNHNVACVQGELDRIVVEYQRKRGIRSRLSTDESEAAARAHAALNPAALEWVRALPRMRRIDMDGIAVMLCHGSPLSPRETLSRDTTVMRLQRLREAALADIIICGAQTSFSRSVVGALFVGVGPLAPGDGSLEYTLISTEEYPWRTESRRIPMPSQ